MKMASWIPACMATCPVGVRAHGYIALIAQCRFREALEVVRRDNPLPGVSGRVCTHPCEESCERRNVDEPLAIAQLKRFIADYELKNNPKMPPPARRTREEKIAIIGSGPAGITAAYYLILKGYGVTVFESLPVLGGMLTSCIPPNRLPQEVVEYEINRIRALGVEMKTGITVGKNPSLENLKKDYAVIFIAVGAYQSLKLDIPGEDDFEGVVDCVTFLRNVNLGQRNKPGERICIVGGGNAALDAARTAIRLGSREVRILYRRSRKEMPTSLKEIKAAQEEGVKILYLVSPNRIIGQNGKVTGVECVKNRLGKPDSSGRRRPVPVAGSEFTVAADCVIPAVSQQPDLSFLPDNNDFKISESNCFIVNPVTLETNKTGIFAGGDDVTGPYTVIGAMAHGRTAATKIDRYLRRLDMEDGNSISSSKITLTEAEINQVDRTTRSKMPTLPIHERKTSFNEVELGFDEEQAVSEAKRCLRCWTRRQN